MTQWRSECYNYPLAEKMVLSNFLSNYLGKCFVVKGFGGLYYLPFFTHSYRFLPIVTHLVVVMLCGLNR